MYNTCMILFRLEGELKERGDEVRKLEGELSRTARGYQENLAQIHSEKDQLLSQLKDSNMQLKAFSVDLESAQAVRSRVEEEAMEQMSELKQCLVDQEHRWKEEVERVKSKHIESTRNLEHTLTAQHRKEIVELERQFEQKLSEQNNSHTQSLRHIKDQYKSEIEKLKGKLSSVSEGSSEECEALRQALKKEKLSGEAEMMSHIRQVRDLELKMKEMGDQEKMLLASQKTREEELRREVDEWRENVAELKGELREREECCSRAVRELEEAKAEISHLESTVQHECEERMELMEALSQAKEQLLAYRRMPSSSHSGSRPTHTHHSGSTTPRSTTPRSTTPRESIEESRQRIASMTGRSRQPPSRGR
jgi:chromosome segregation ATPase